MEDSLLLNSKIEFLVIHCSDSEDTLSYNAMTFINYI